MGIRSRYPIGDISDPLKGLQDHIDPLREIRKHLDPLPEFGRAADLRALVDPSIQGAAVELQKFARGITQEHKAAFDALKASRALLGATANLQQQVSTASGLSTALGFVTDTSILRSAIELQSTFRELRAALPVFTNVFQEAYDNLQRGLLPLRGALARIGAVERACSRIEGAGWLPHYTTPFAMIEGAEEEEDLGPLLEGYYADHWDEVEAEFRARLDGYEIDDEARAAIGEALTAHRHGLYRAAIRTVFPELERLARQYFDEGSLRGTASLRTLRRLARTLPAGAIEPGGFYALRLFAKLVDHLYAQVETIEQLARVAADTTPNRHATLHGLVSYNNRQGSVNALIMSDFVIQVICAVRAYEMGEAQAA